MPKPVAIKVEVAVSGGDLEDGQLWRPRDVHTENETNFVKLASNDTVLYQFLGLKGSPRKLVDHNGFLQHLRIMRNQSTDAALLVAYKERVDPLAQVLPKHARSLVEVPTTVKVCFPACPPDFGPCMLEMLTTSEPVKAPSVRVNESQLAYLSAYAQMFENS